MSPEEHVRSYIDAHITDAAIEIPPDQSLGDFAIPCFHLSKIHKKAPQIIASELADELPKHPGIDRIEAKGPYLNIFLDRAWMAEQVLQAEITCEKKNKKLLIEYLSPNPNKPLHLGHLRNMLLGSSLVNISRAAGYDVIAAILNNDRGIHICKSMLAYQKLGGQKTPEEMGLKGDHFVGHWYVQFQKHAQEHPELEEQAQEMLRKWEAGDEEVRALWKKTSTWALKGHKQTCERLGITFDRTYYESDIYDIAKNIVLDGLERGLFERDEKGNVVVDLEELGTKVLLRADDTTIYMTQDIHLADMRQKEENPDAQIYVVGEEQKHHFKQLFAILEKLGMEHAESLYHLWYGLIALPEGRMKSREGTVVDTDDLLEEMESLAKHAVLERHDDLTQDEVELRARAIGDAALRFFIIKYDPKTAFTYDPKESLSFEGETGPYIQYAIARIASVLKDAPSGDVDYTKIAGETEYSLIRLLSQTVQVVEEAAESYKPHLVARHALNIAQSFTQFYHECKVLVDDQSVSIARAELCRATKTHLEYLLDLLGIQSLDAM